MRPYSRGVFTWAAAKSVQPFEPGVAGWGTAGALLPDVPAVAGAVWLAVRRLDRFSHKEFGIEVCGRKLFCGPEAALRPALPVAALLAVYTAPDTRARDPRGALLAFLLGWTGHVIVDSLTHARDARPISWPLSKRRFASPISYWDRVHHVRLFSLGEHATLLVAVAWLLSRGSGAGSVRNRP